MAKPVAVELFCGVGGMTLGFERAGFNVVGAFDWDKRNVEYHKINFPKSLTFEKDISDLSASEILKLCKLSPGSIDVLFGGPPCQGFSVIGHKDNADERNLLILDFARLVDELRPRYFVVENVRGLLFNYSKPTLDKFLHRVKNSGYEILNPIQLLDASEFGVPQKRRRAFILGHLKGQTAPRIPRPTSKKGEVRPPPTVEDAIGDLPDISTVEELLADDMYYGELGAPSEYAASLRASGPAGATSNAGGLSGCLRTIHSPQTQLRFLTTVPGTYEPISRCYRLNSAGISYTLRAGSDVKNGSFTAARPIHPTQPRCITTREAARLHSFPDWFRFHPTKWHGFRQVGNAVPPLLAEAVAREIKKAIAKRSSIKRKPKRSLQPV